MAILLMISLSYYCQIENGKRKLDYIMAVKISSIFYLQPDDLFYEYFSKNKIRKEKPKLIVISTNLPSEEASNNIKEVIDY